MKILLCNAIHQANQMYQERVRGTSDGAFSDLIRASVLRMASLAFQTYGPRKLKNRLNRPVVRYVCEPLLFYGLSSYGLRRGYNVNFIREFAAIRLHEKIHHRIALSTKNEKIKLIMFLFFLMGSTFLQYKFESNRNSIPLNPYVYCFGGARLAMHLKKYFFDKKIHQALSKKFFCDDAKTINHIVSYILITFSAAQATRFVTGHSIQISWKAQIFTSIATGVLQS